MEDEDSRTVWCGNLADSVTEELLYELFLQAAPLERLRIPQDRGGRKANYAFIVFKHAKSVPYTVQLMNGISIFDKKLNIKPRCKNQMNEVQSNHPNVRDRLGIRGNEPLRNDIALPLTAPGFENMGNIYFQNLFQLGQMMNVVDMQHGYLSTMDNRQNDYRDNRNTRDYRREEHKPYGRNERYGRNHDRNNYENNRRHRHY